MENLPQSRQSCVETLPIDLQRPSTATHLDICTYPESRTCIARIVVDSQTFSGTIARVVLRGIGNVRWQLHMFRRDSRFCRWRTAWTDGRGRCNVGGDRSSATCPSLLSAIGRQLLKVSGRLCYWCGKNWAGCVHPVLLRSPFDIVRATADRGIYADVMSWNVFNMCRIST